MRKKLKKRPHNSHLEKTVQEIQPIRQKLTEHDVYSQINSIQDLRIFMQHHIYAVYDFMTLLKALQRELTCVSIPWTPKTNGLNRHLINDIVLEEESDETPNGKLNSHFEMHLKAMEDIDADTKAIENVVNAIDDGEKPEAALNQAGVPESAEKFVNSTMELAFTGEVHEIAGAFTFGREGLIPNMFQSHIKELEKDTPELETYYYYLERHMELDEEEHGPMALRMLTNLCGEDEEKWKETKEASIVELESRINLWDSIEEKIQAS
ncbi:MAG: DUF3050 domain-containing protein [Halobacteria archaeon]